MLKLHLHQFTILCATCSTLPAAIITFESPTYTVGTLASTAAGTTDRAFTGQDGWSASTGGNAGAVVATTTSGEYSGGQAISGGTATYIGARQGSIDFDMSAGITISFDLRYGTGQEMGVGFWGDSDNDNLFDQSETGVLFGVVSDGTSPYAMGMRYANFSTRAYSNGTGGVVTSGASPVTGTAASWYHFAITILPNGANYDISMSVRNLTNSTDVDFNSTLGGANPFTATLTAIQFGVNPYAADGIAARATTSGSNGLLDNVRLTIPEPGVTLLGGLGLLGLLRRRRH